MNVEKVKKFSVKNAGRIANATFDLALVAFCIVMSAKLNEIGQLEGAGVVLVAGLTEAAKAGIETGAIINDYREASN